MIDEKKIIKELEKWMNDTAYLKEKYSGATQFKDGTGENIMYTHAEIAHEVISEVIGKINEQQKVGEWIPCSERLPEEPLFEKGYIVQSEYIKEPFSAYWDGENWTDVYDEEIEVIAWQTLPKPFQKG